MLTLPLWNPVLAVFLLSNRIEGPNDYIRVTAPKWSVAVYWPIVPDEARDESDGHRREPPLLGR